MAFRADNENFKVKVHFKICGSDYSFAYNFLAWSRLTKISVALESWWKILDFTWKINQKNKTKRREKWRWKNATHWNLMSMALQITWVVAQSFSSCFMQSLNIWDHFFKRKWPFSGHWWIFFTASGKTQYICWQRFKYKDGVQNKAP